MRDYDELQNMVNALELFDDLSEREKSTLLAIVDSQTYQPGEVLCREGDRAFSFFILCRGQVEVFKELSGDNRQLLGQLGPGSMVGQVSLIDGKARSASVHAKTEVVTLECSRDDFERLFNAGSPFAFKIMDQIIVHLTKRLRDANRQLYNLYSRPTETMYRLQGAVMDIQRTISDTHDQIDVEVIRSKS